MNEIRANDDQEILALLRSVLRMGKVAEVRLDNLLNEVDLSATRLLTLRQLEAANEPLSLSQLASCLTFAKSNATQLVDRLEADGLVRRVPAPNDRRCTLLELTGEGRVRQGEALEAIQPLLRKLSEAYSPEERAQLLALLKRLTDVIG